MLIHELMAHYAAEDPSKTAAADARGEMSYGELEARSAAAARALARLGAGGGKAVAVYVPYAKEIVLGAFSAWRAGCIHLPMDDAYPEERLNYMLENSGAAALLTVRDLWTRKPLQFPEEKVIFLDEQPAEENAEGPQVSLTEDSPAMLLYTSGTTSANINASRYASLNPISSPNEFSILRVINEWVSTKSCFFQIVINLFFHICNRIFSIPLN